MSKPLILDLKENIYKETILFEGNANTSFNLIEDATQYDKIIIEHTKNEQGYGLATSVIDKPQHSKTYGLYSIYAGSSSSDDNIGIASTLIQFMNYDNRVHFERARTLVLTLLGNYNGNSKNATTITKVIGLKKGA